MTRSAKPFHLLLGTTFALPAWDEAVQQKVIAYWGSRGVVFAETSGHSLTGHRGSLWANLYSFDMSRLKARLAVSVDAQLQCTCTLDICTHFQIITELNLDYWKLELGTFESFLLHDDLREEEWAEFQRAYAKAAWLWSLSFGMLGKRRTRRD